MPSISTQTTSRKPTRIVIMNPISKFLADLEDLKNTVMEYENNKKLLTQLAALTIEDPADFENMWQQQVFQNKNRFSKLKCKSRRCLLKSIK